VREQEGYKKNSSPDKNNEIQVNSFVFLSLVYTLHFWWWTQKNPTDQVRKRLSIENAKYEF
jgi:hypothetical protein